MKYNYNEIRDALLKGNIELLINYDGTSYWITIDKVSSFGDSEGKVDLVFSSPDQLLNAALIDNKTLFEMWDDVDVDSYESGWNSTINVY